MKIRRTSAALYLLLISPLDFTSALFAEREVGSSAEGIQLAKDASDISLPSASQQPAKPVVDGVGTKDAPVDGKDGRPHSGPFVETSAERDRKKAKESGDDVPKAPVKEVSSKGTSSEDGLKMPETNDGVMDDPNRTGPKEGTRGTEGGISEKTKDSKEEKKGDSEKKPDPPKEVPPLPHSEQQKLGKETAKDDGKKGKDGATQDGDKKKEDDKKDDKKKELGGLEVGQRRIFWTSI